MANLVKQSHGTDKSELLGVMSPHMLTRMHSTKKPGNNQSVGSSAPVVSRCFPGGYNVKLYISRGRLEWWLLAFLHSDGKWLIQISLVQWVHFVIGLILIIVFPDQFMLG